MKINLKELDSSTWVDYQGDIKLKIRPLSVSKNKELEKECTGSDGKIDPDALNKKLPDYIIEDWEGFIDQDDQPIPCTLEMKVAILNHFHDLRLWALKTATNLFKVKQEQQKKKLADS